MARTQRRFNVFSLSFLDVMSCGFGAVVLIFLIINHAVEDDTQEVNRDLLAEVRKLDYEIDTGEKDLVDLQETLEGTRARISTARRELLAMLEDLERRKAGLDELEAETIARQEDVEELQSDVETRQEDVEKLQAQEELSKGRQLIEVTGEGDRQYLTGLFVGGRYVLIALDASASMLDETIVQVIRRRNMPRERQLQAPKWERARRTVEWLAAQVPIGSNFQIMVFNTGAQTLLPTTNWYPATDQEALDSALALLADTVPAGGTSLEPVMSAINGLRPRPDNVYLIVDSLPTQGDRPPRGSTVDGRTRRSFFENATKRLPAGVPFNIILFPMEGDPMASEAYWSLASVTGGAYLSPSRDWP